MALHVVAGTRPLPSNTLLVGVSDVHLSNTLEVPGHHFEEPLHALALIHLCNPRVERRAANKILDMLSARRVTELLRNAPALRIFDPGHLLVFPVNLADRATSYDR